MLGPGEALENHLCFFFVYPRYQDVVLGFRHPLRDLDYLFRILPFTKDPLREPFTQLTMVVYDGLSDVLKGESFQPLHALSNSERSLLNSMQQFF